MPYLKLYDLHVFVSIIHSCGRDVHLNVGHFPQLRGCFFFVFFLFFFFQTEEQFYQTTDMPPVVLAAHCKQDLCTEMCLLSTRVYACLKFSVHHTSNIICENK